jgi:hypothetical protein
MHESLDLARAVDADEICQLPTSAGLYAIWRDAGSHVEYYDTLLYVGKTEPARGEGIRQRIADYLSGKRPNETLYFWIIDLLVRPNLQVDRRHCAAIAAEYLSECQFAGWPWDQFDSQPTRSRGPAKRCLVHSAHPELVRPADRRDG